MVAVFAFTMFVSAGLLFVVQPMVAKLLLPNLGGSSAVWTTCMLFFQAVLLAGYGYAHLSARFLAPKWQASLHIPIMVLAAATLPIALPELGIDASQAPTMWLLAALLLAVGFPFFVVSTSAPLLQFWFAHTGHPDADDPYHLYAASNLGSMAALIGYPFLIEPYLGVRMQTWAWAGVYLLLIVMSGGCAMLMRKGIDARAPAPDRASAAPLTVTRRLKWVLWAFLPSSLMLGFTHYLTTDIAAVPLLWVVPLALYLLTFILVFAKRRVLLPSAFRLVLPLMVLGIWIVTAYKPPMFVVIAAHLSAFFLLTMFFHGELARDRPEAVHLTEFFLLLSVGGALGGLFNAIIAPLLLNMAIDYILVLVAAVALIEPSQWRTSNKHGNRFVIPVLLFPAGAFYLHSMSFWTLTNWERLVGAAAVLAAPFALSALRPRWENVGLAFVLAVGAVSYFETPGILSYERSFFAAYKVFEREYRDAGRFRKFSHGTTTHGAQSLDPEKASIPVSYHHPEGPVGQILQAIPHKQVLVVGLGAGAMTAYAKEGTHFDVYEIDPLVEEIAREHFTYLQMCGDRCTVKIGDGRKLVADEPDGKYDIIFLDAYNSDAVPTHLLTREALDLYLSKLAPDGVVVFHVSNRYLDIEGVVGAIVEDAGLVSRTQLHVPPKKERRRRQIDASCYTVVAREESHLRTLALGPRWKPTKPANVLWTDDFTNVVSVFEWD